jgi:hypothetical protein
MYISLYHSICEFYELRLLFKKKKKNPFAKIPSNLGHLVFSNNHFVGCCTIGGGFGHPLGSMGVAEPPLGAQGGGYDHPSSSFSFPFFFLIFFLKKLIN